MSGGVPCRCPTPDRRRWRIWQYKSHRSAFAGYHETPSEYSAVTCLDCRGIWRTKARYVEALKHAEAETGTVIFVLDGKEVGRIVNIGTSETMTARCELEARIFRKVRGRRWTHRRWWIRLAAIAVGLASISRRMGDPKSAAAELDMARYYRRIASGYGRRAFIPR